MYILKVIINACVTILSTKIDLLGYSISLVNVSAYLIIASFLLFLFRKAFN